MQIFLIRHARPCSPLCNVDVELAPEGIEQTLRLAKRFQNMPKLDAIYTSDFLRARQTGEILGKELNVPVHTGYTEFNEIDFGALTGLSDAQIKEQYGEFMKKRSEATEDLAFPKGECGGDVWNRAYPLLCSLAEQKMERIAIVTHGGVIRSLVAGVLHMSQRYKLLLVKCLENTAFVELKYNQQTGQFFVERLNDYAHLEGQKRLLRENFKRTV